MVPEEEDASGLVARSPAMRKLVDLARRIAKVDSTVLITGESGTGKERIARLVHEASPRAEGPFIAVNCGAITETLLESELFGHVRGAFTGAAQDRPGLFEAASGGTLLLDEIGEVSPATQVKLLRTLQEREVRRVGENRSRPVDVRVIAATNRDLAACIIAGGFRKDLYYRLNVVELHVPALRDRREDILPLAHVLLAEAGLRLKRPMSGLSPRAADQLLRYDWPGNVRELENAMERAVAIAPVGRTEIDDLPDDVRRAIPPPPSNPPVMELEDVEKEYILAALEANLGNQTRTAGQLGIGTATLYRKLKKYGALRGGRNRKIPAAGPAHPPVRASRGRIRVVLADDHRVVRQGLVALLRGEPDIEVVGEAADGAEAVDQARALCPDVMILDVSMPGQNGLAAARTISEDVPEVRVIGLSMYDEADLARAMREAGAVGFVSKGGPPGALVAAIREAVREERTARKVRD